MQKIGRYEVVRRLGAGGFATVYLVRDPVLDSEVAAKVLAENWSDKADLRERFVREAQLLRRIDSDRVVTVHDIGEIEESGQPYFVMALVDRGTLDERLTVMPAPVAADIRNVGVQLAECVGTIHANNLIHRDIKPSNLLIAGPRLNIGSETETGLLGPAERLVLGDFGLAKDINLQSTVGFTISAGTGGYAAPEQMSPVGVPDRQTDLYAATGVMYRVITAETPPGFDLATETVPFPDGAQWMAGELGRFFRQGMAFYPEQRHPSVEAWLGDLESVIASINGGLPEIPGGGPSGPSTWAPPVVDQPAVQPPTVRPGQIHPGPNPVVSSGNNRIVDPRSMPTPVVSSGQNPVVHPQTHQQPPVVVSHQNTLPQQHHSAPYGQPSIQQSPISYEQPKPRPRIGRWIMSGVLLAAAVAGGWFFFLRPAGPTIAGPDTIEAGEEAVYSATYANSQQFRWTDWTGATVEGDTFPVDAVAPGALTFSVVAIDADGGMSPSTEQTITITASPDGPVIIGESQIAVGGVYEYTFTDPTGGATNPRWIDEPNGEQAGEVYRLEPSRPGQFRFTLLVTLADGTVIGSVKVVEIVEG